MIAISAYTETGGAPYPGFISLNEMHTEADPHKVVLTVRQQGHLGMKQSSIVLPKPQMLKLVADILEYLNTHPEGL
jgi:hypothetical protein